MQPFPERLKSTTLIEDLGQLVAQQQDLALTPSKDQEWFEGYHTLEEIEAYMNMLQQSYPAHVKVTEIGKTHEGRSILALKIGDGLDSEPPSPPEEPQPEPQPQPQPQPEPQPQPQPHPHPQPDPPINMTWTEEKLGVMITGGQHAREWISTSTSLFFAADLLHAALGNRTQPNATFSAEWDAFRRKSRKGRNKTRQTWTRSSALSVLRTFTISVIPVTNPDGYVYSWTHNRMWRKNRQPNKFPSGLFCKGVDLNRNWAYGFATDAVRTLAGPCSEMYAGTTAFSALETSALATYMSDAANNVRAYFDLHSYGQLLMYPFSHSCNEPVGDEEDLLELSLGAVSALKRVHGRQFNAGKVCAVYAQGGGNSIDWSYASTQGASGDDKKPIKWSFSIELRDGGTYGFLLPPKQIVPAADELSAALSYMFDFIAKKESHSQS